MSSTSPNCVGVRPWALPISSETCAAEVAQEAFQKASEREAMPFYHREHLQQQKLAFTPKEENTWWRLVWCHERCHKWENEQRRQDMCVEAAKIGAGVVYLKKAKQFTSWIERAPRPVFVLITDWREAQPCLQALSQHQGRNRPVGMIVVCESPRQYGRASEWAKRVPPEVGKVQVCEKSNIPASLLEGLVLKCFGGEEYHQLKNDKIRELNADEFTGSNDLEDRSTEAESFYSNQEPWIEVESVDKVSNFLPMPQQARICEDPMYIPELDVNQSFPAATERNMIWPPRRALTIQELHAATVAIENGALGKRAEDFNIILEAKAMAPAIEELPPTHLGATLLKKDPQWIGEVASAGTFRHSFDLIHAVDKKADPFDDVAWRQRSVLGPVIWSW